METISPKQTLLRWIEAFNHTDADALAELYADAVNHQVANEPIVGKAAIKQMFRNEFTMADMVCPPENSFEDGEWVIIEWKDPQGLCGCGFFHVLEGKIALQRGYWDKLSFYKLHNIPLQESA